MSNVERTGWRDHAYSAWHREALSDVADVIDLDWMERCHVCKRLLAVYETAVDNGRNDGKAYFATRDLARRAELPGYLVLYAKSGSHITGFRVKRVAPGESDDEFTRFTPEQWAEHLRKLRRCHPIEARPNAAPRPIGLHLCEWVKDADGFRCIHCGERYQVPA